MNPITINPVVNELIPLCDAQVWRIKSYKEEILKFTIKARKEEKRFDIIARTVVLDDKEFDNPDCQVLIYCDACGGRTIFTNLVYWQEEYWIETVCETSPSDGIRKYLTRFKQILEIAEFQGLPLYYADGYAIRNVIFRWCFGFRRRRLDARYEYESRYSAEIKSILYNRSPAKVYNV